MSQRANVDTQALVDEIKRGLPVKDTLAAFSRKDFDLLCENIANAIAGAIERYDAEVKSPEPDFGEEERVTG